MLTASPKGTVPALFLRSGDIIDESNHIMGWALEQADPDGWGKRPATRMTQEH